MAYNRDDFTQKTIEVIASRVGYKCSNPNCKVQTRGPHTNPEKKVSIGEAAHITAAAPDGPRYDATLTKEQRKSADNGIWLCSTHARLVDKDEVQYPVELLRGWKEQAEYEQHCIVNNTNNINLNSNHARYKEALRQVSKNINEIHNIYEYFKKYYDENLSRIGNFIQVNNRIMEMRNLYGNDLYNMRLNLNNANYSFANDYSEYELDISVELKEKINEYFKVICFTSWSDGELGTYSDYYEKLFEMLDKNYNDMTKVIKEINQIIQKEYNSIL